MEFRDLLGGGAAACGTTLMCIVSSSESPLQFDIGADGACALPLSWTSLRLVSGPWLPREIRPSDLSVTDTVWLYRMGHVRGRVVTTEGGVQPVVGARVSTRTAGGPPNTPVTPATLTWMDGVAGAYGIARTDPVATDDDGAFEFDAPMTAGLLVHAAADGFAPSVVEVQVSAGEPDPAWITVSLGKALRITGRVTSADGAPAAGAYVWARVQEVRDGRHPLRTVERFGNCAVSIGGDSDGRSIVTFSQRVMTDTDGRYSIPVPASGPVTMHVFARGSRLHRSMVGVVDASRDAVDVVLDEAPMGDRLRLLLDGKPLLHADFLASDLSTDDGIQTYTDAVELDAEGRAPSEWLIAGHRYCFIVRSSEVSGGRKMGFVRWNGQPTIEITQLSMTKDLE